MHDLKGKKIVVTAGSTREDIDGVRHYANHLRFESHGYAVAEKLAALGAEVTVIAAKNNLAAPLGCRVEKHHDGEEIRSGRDVMDATEAFVKANACDAVLCLASISALRPAEVAANKLKVKNVPGADVTMPVVGNIDIQKRVGAWSIPCLGYTTRQELFSTSNAAGWFSSLGELVADQGATSWPTTIAVDDDLPEPKASSLKGRKVIITSGPTEEQLTTTGDVITNFSSGQQGSQIARVCAAAGASVAYIVGRTSYPVHNESSIVTHRVTSAKTMLAAAEAALPADVFIGVAAVADFGCKEQYDLHLAEGEAQDLMLGQNPDILHTMGHHATKRPALVIGFAAETDPNNILAYANGKLEKKRADMICANLVGRSLAHAESENQIIFVTPHAEPHTLAVMSKSAVAVAIVEEIASYLPPVASHDAKNSSAPSTLTP
jgi:phosphopantothenoylcysteine synthetase/decarboxylase